MTSPAGGGPWRLFVALPVPDAVRDRLAAVLDPLRDATSEHLRWVPADTWHLTLAFLGDVEASRVPEVGAAVEAGVAAWSGASFDVRVKGASRFGRGLLFLGVDDGAFAATVSVGAAVRDALGRAGVWSDDKPLHPHLTLARQRDRRGRGVSRSQLDAVEDALSTAGVVTWTVDEVVLFRSHLGHGPVRHEPVRAVALG